MLTIEVEPAERCALVRVTGEVDHNRTETDLYLWLSRNRREFAARYEHTVLMTEAADDLARQAEDHARPIKKLGEKVTRATARWRKGKGRG